MGALVLELAGSSASTWPAIESTIAGAFVLFGADAIAQDADGVDLDLHDVTRLHPDRRIALRADAARRTRDAMLAGGHTEVWAYRFDWDEAPAMPFVRPDLLLGAAHAMEMAFAFRDTAGELDIFGVNTPFNRAGRAVLAHPGDGRCLDQLRTRRDADVAKP